MPSENIDFQMIQNDKKRPVLRIKGLAMHENMVLQYFFFVSFNKINFEFCYSCHLRLLLRTRRIEYMRKIN